MLAGHARQADAESVDGRAHLARRRLSYCRRLHLQRSVMQSSTHCTGKVAIVCLKCNVRIAGARHICLVLLFIYDHDLSSQVGTRLLISDECRTELI